MWLTTCVDSIEQNQLMNSVETEAWLHATDSCQRGGAWGSGSKKVKGLREKKKNINTIHGNRRQYGEHQWERGWGMWREAREGET